MKIFAKIKSFFINRTDSDLFGTNIRDTIRSFCNHEWEFRVEKGEEEHGMDPSKRYCKKCNKCQHGYYHRYGDIRVTWED